jgi:hypothetical protein
MSRLTTSETRALDLFRIENPNCWSCGQDVYCKFRKDGIDYGHWLEIHHLQKRGRAMQRWCWAMLCKLCHDLAEGHTIKHQGERLPNLSLENCLWLKRYHDPEHYDRAELLAHSRSRFLPRAQKLPEYFGVLQALNCGRVWTGTRYDAKARV